MIWFLVSEAFVLTQYNENDRQLCNLCVCASNAIETHSRCVRYQIIRNIVVVYNVFYIIIIYPQMFRLSYGSVRFGSSIYYLSLTTP